MSVGSQEHDPEHAVRAVAERLWPEWTRVTRFLRSGLIALDHEIAFLERLPLADDESVLLSARSPGESGSEYEISLAGHKAAVGDHGLFLAAVLIHSYALTEAAADEVLDIRSDSGTGGGIESWATRLLNSAPRADERRAASGGKGPWSTSLPRAAVAHTAIVRNAFAHGTREIRSEDVTRLSTARDHDKENAAPAPAAAEYRVPDLSEGDAITLTFDDVQRHRRTLQGVLRLSAIESH
jgi:hypothetical protein